MEEVLSDPKYRGKHVLVFDGKLYVSKTGNEQAKTLKKLTKENPKVIPEIAFMPKGTWI